MHHARIDVEPFPYPVPWDILINPGWVTVIFTGYVNRLALIPQASIRASTYAQHFFYISYPFTLSGLGSPLPEHTCFFLYVKSLTFLDS